MAHYLDLQGVSPKRIYPLSAHFQRRGPNGGALAFTNYYMELDGAPFYGISGEIHYARLWEERWEDAILKMKAGGINTISTYIFWIHHEEVEGALDFTGRRNLRRFVELCGKHGLYVIIRIGPFNHGECRNGGLPDWLYGKPFEVRSLDEGFLACTRRLYRRLGRELEGLFYQDGGPIIAAQVDNEYMHSAAPWEATTGTSGERMTTGTLGDDYLLRLRDMAREEGIDTPFYTCTGWGGAATPEALMPLWGGYAFQPWLFYNHVGEHPATEEYIYRDNHNNAVPATYNFAPFYPPESKPYLCCEMGGGMFCSYHYRFQIDFASVDAMANVKMGSGCNMLGYYMYHGGTNPKGERTPFLNEGQVPKLSYDFQAAIGEFGQVRDSFRRLRALHLLVASFGRALCRTKTVLPEGSQAISPRDVDTLRYAVRVDGEGAGFLFLNNYQDHAEMRPKQDEMVTLRLPREEICFPGLSLAPGENCILPFGLDIRGIQVRSALAQPLTVLDVDNQPHAFFFAPQGMTPSYTFPAGTEIQCGANACRVAKGEFVRVDGGPDFPLFTAVQGEKKVHFVTLSREQSLRFSVVEQQGRRVAVLSEGIVLADRGGLRVEHSESVVSLCVFPNGILPLNGAIHEGEEGIFTRYRLEKQPVAPLPGLERVGPARYVVRIPPWDTAAVKELLLQIHYQGDIGSAFIDGGMISDNFCNGAAWEIGLREFSEQLREHPMTITITPAEGRGGAGSPGPVESVTVKTVYEWTAFGSDRK